MMNDRFSAELRQHLLSTADERPADGRLAAIVEGVAVTRQRHPLVSRLPWSPTRLDAFPSRAMRYGLLAAALIVAVVGVAVFAVGQTHRTPFEGTWTSIDPADGSTQTLVVGAGASPSVRFEDQFATGAACVNDAVKVFTADGTGVIADDHLATSFPDGGGCGSMTVRVILEFVYDDGTDSLRDQDGVDWVRARGDRPALPSPTTPTPTPTEAPASPAPTPHPGETAFTSKINGFSMGVPKGWKSRAATQAWTGRQLDFDSPQADVVFDPRHGKDLYLLVASRPFADIGADAWSASVLQWTCPDEHGEFWGWHVDGAYSFQRGPCNSGSIVQTDTRGYLIRLVASTEALAADYDWDWLKPMLETVDLRPEDAIAPAGAAKPLPTCAEIAAGATYTNRFGSPKLTATIPDGAKSSWQGYRDAFELGARCPGPISITASTIDTVLTDPCDQAAGAGGNVTTPAEAAEAMAAHIGHRTSQPTDVTIDGHDALRLEISTEGSTCTDPFSLWPGIEIGPDEDAIIYLVDVGEEHPLGIGVWYERAATTPAQVAEAEAIVDSIQIE